MWLWGLNSFQHTVVGNETGVHTSTRLGQVGTGWVSITPRNLGIKLAGRLAVAARLQAAAGSQQRPGGGRLKFPGCLTLSPGPQLRSGRGRPAWHGEVSIEPDEPGRTPDSNMTRRKGQTLTRMYRYNIAQPIDPPSLYLISSPARSRDEHYSLEILQKIASRPVRPTVNHPLSKVPATPTTLYSHPAKQLFTPHPQPYSH